MAATDLILYKPMILLTTSATSLSGLEPVAAAKQVSFGQVSKIYDTCDKVSVGDSVLFNQEDAFQVSDSGVIYYLINENYLIAEEPFIP